MHGIEHSKRVLEDLGKIVINGVDVAKNGVGISSLRHVWDLMHNTQHLIKEAQQALPELSDLDAAEAQELAGHCYLLVRNIVSVVV